MSEPESIRFVPLGDRALLVYLPDEATAVRWATALTDAAFPWVVDLVPAYTSVGVHFDPDRITLQGVRDTLRTFDAGAMKPMCGRRHIIPVCYEYQLDLARVASLTGLTSAAVIARHTQAEYTVYAIGFCPGFPYLGYLPDELSHVPRLPQPRVRLEAGSVGLTGRQTGIYPLVRPGGWNIIGRTPLQLVDVAAGYFPLQVGDIVQFRAIDEHEFRQLEGQRL